MTQFDRRLSTGTLPGSSILLGYSNPVDVAVRAFTKLNGHDFCGECRLCRRAALNVHPELFLSDEDSMDEARRLVSATNLHTSEVEVRLLAILGPRSSAFQNTLLKTLEDPGPTNRILMFGSSQTEFIETVRSRAEIFRTAPASEGYIDPDVKARAIEFIELSRKRNVLSVVVIPEVWDRPLEVLAEIARLLLEESMVTGNWRPYDAACRVYSVARRGRPHTNAMFSLTEALVL